MPPIADDVLPVTASPASVPAPLVAESRHRLRRFVALPLLVSMVIVLALLAYEVGLPRRAADVRLHQFVLRRAFSLDVPLRWAFVVDDPRTTVFTDPDQPDTSHGVRVVTSIDPLDKVRKRLAGVGRQLVGAYRPVDTVTGLRVDGRPAFRHDFVGKDTVVQQWWVQRGKGTFRIDLWVRPDFAEETRALHERIVRSFHEL
jgi:hypothetical protein